LPQYKEFQSTSEARNGEKTVPSSQALAEKAIIRFQGGYNCAQSVLLTLYEHMEAEGKNELIPKIATGFGGGIGRCGSVCGALTGGVMAVGIKYGTNETGVEKRAKAYAHAQTLYKQFEKQHGTVLCRDLIKYDLSNPEEAAKARQEKVFEKVCANFIKAAIENFLELENK
jgi:C_GCAxxG_C_C family probable redox protein